MIPIPASKSFYGGSMDQLPAVRRGSEYDTSPSSRGNTQEPYSAKDEFDEQLEAATRISAVDNRKFVLASQITAWMRQPSHNGVTNVARLLNIMVQGGGETPRQFDQLLVHMDNSDEKCWLRTFAILLQITYSNGENMGKHIVRFFHLDILDRRLGTLRRRQLKKIVAQHLSVPELDYNLVANRLWELQWRMCTVEAFHETFKQKFAPGEMILPITKHLLIKKGGTGAIYLIEVPRECVHQSLAAKLKRKPYVNYVRRGNWEGQYQQLALKVLSNKKMYYIETRAYDALYREEGIVECFGYWQFDGQFHLLLEWGSYDLERFFQIHTPPTTTEAILQFWDAMGTIMQALSKIHKLETLNHAGFGNYKIYYHGWHCDLKPANILFCEEGHKKGWKIADLGFAKFELEGRARIHDGLPVILNTEGTTEYCGPETQGGGETLVTQFFDIWSMGCILSEAATWVILGHRGVELFRLVRKSEASQHRAADTELTIDDQFSIMTDRSDTNTRDKSDNEEIRGSDHFHNGFEISDAVKEWHTYLKHSLRTLDPVTSKILELVEAHMLQGIPKHRADASSLATLIKRIISAAKNNSTNAPVSTGYKPPSYFKKAIRLEQDIAAERIHRPLIEESSETWRDKYKSRVLLEDMKKPVGTTDEELIENFEKQKNIMPDQKSGRILHRTSTAPSHYPLGSHNMIFSQISEFRKTKSPPDGEYADYRQAREILEKAGWITGTLEIPEMQLNAPVISLQSPLSQPAASTLWSTSSSPLVTPAREKSKYRYSMSLVKQKINTIMTTKRKSVVSPPMGTSQASVSIPETAGPTVIQQGQNSRSNQSHAISEDHKDKKISSYLENRDIAFLVDNGSSMAEHWIWARELLAVLVAFLYGQDDDGMELYFTSFKKPVGTFQQPKEFVELMNKNGPKPEGIEGLTANRSGVSPIDTNFARSSTVLTTASDESNPEDIREVLGVILAGWSKKYLKQQRKLTLIVLTDGIWRTPSARSKRMVANEIIHALEKWQDKGPLNEQLSSRDLSIQFIRFGHDPDAIEELEWMDDHLTATDGTILPDIIDHTPADGNIYKMILGSLNSRNDDEDTTITKGDEIIDPFTESEVAHQGKVKLTQDTSGLIDLSLLPPINVSNTADMDQGSPSMHDRFHSDQNVDSLESEDSENSDIISTTRSCSKKPLSSFARNRNKSLRKNSTQLETALVTTESQASHIQTHYDSLFDLKTEVYQKSATGIFQRNGLLPQRIFDQDHRILESHLFFLDSVENRDDTLLDTQQHIKPSSFERLLSDSAGLSEDVRHQLLALLHCRVVMYLVDENIARLQKGNFMQHQASIFVADDTREDVASLISIPIKEFNQITHLRDSIISVTNEVYKNVTITENSEWARNVTLACQECLAALGLAGENEVDSGLWYSAVFLVDLAVLAYAGAHTELFNLGTSVIYEEFDVPGSMVEGASSWIQLSRFKTKCLDEFLGHEKLWVFHRGKKKAESLYISSTIGDLADIWGPIWSIGSGDGGDDVDCFDMGSGQIFPWVHDPQLHPALKGGDSERLCHWIPKGSPYRITTEDPGEQQVALGYLGNRHKTVSMESPKPRALDITARLLIGAKERHRARPNMRWVRCDCQINVLVDTLKGQHRLESLGAKRPYSYVDGRTVSLVGGYYFSMGGNVTIKRMKGIPFKDVFFDMFWEKRGRREPRDLENLWGVAVSMCTMNAERVPLFDLLHTPSMLRYLESFEWADADFQTSFLDTLIEGDLDKLCRLWVENRNWRDEFGSVLLYCFQALSHTGFDSAREEFSAFWVSPNTTLPKNILLAPGEYNWTKLLRDSPTSFTVAVMVEERLAARCGRKRCGDQQGPSVLRTSLCINNTIDPYPQLLRREVGATWDLSRLEVGACFPLGARGRLKTIQVLPETSLLVKWDFIWRKAACGVLGMHWKRRDGHWEYTEVADRENRLSVYVLSSE